MGTTLAGIAFKPTRPVDDFRALVSKLCGEEAVAVEQPVAGGFDIRDHADVMVLVFGEVCFICNNDIAWGLLEKPASDVAFTHQALGCPDSFMVFCRYDSGGSYGYALVEKGERVRSRLQTTDVPGLPPLIEFGEPLDSEKRWLAAPYYFEDEDGPEDEREKIFYQGEPAIEVPEYFLTSRMLDEALVSRFGVCPWNTDVKPVCHMFRLTGARKPWWRLW